MPMRVRPANRSVRASASALALGHDRPDRAPRDAHQLADHGTRVAVGPCSEEFTLYDAAMSSESYIFPPRAAIMRKFWHTFAMGSATTAGTVALGLLAGVLQGWPGWLAGLAALALLVFSHIRWSDAAEYLAKAKGIYHPMYGVLGPIGLVMAISTRSAPDLTGAKPTKL